MKPKYLVEKQYFVSDSNKAINSGELGNVITLQNSTGGEVKLDSLILKFDSSVTGIKNIDFEIVQSKITDKILSIGSMKLGIFGTPLSASYERIIQIKQKIIIPKSEGINLKLNKPSINISANKIFMQAEFLSLVEVKE